MTQAAKMRMERIERLLRELEYEVTRGVMEREIEEEIGFRFIIPVSNVIKDGQVFCEFRTRPTPRGNFIGEPEAPRLKIVENGSGGAA